jgi:hypothetical protein
LSHAACRARWRSASATPIDAAAACTVVEAQARTVRMQTVQQPYDALLNLPSQAEMQAGCGHTLLAGLIACRMCEGPPQHRW